MKKIYFVIILFAIPIISLLAQTADKITVVDTRDVNSPPNTYNKEVKFEFKHRTTIGVPGSGSYSGNMTFAPWADNSGDKSHQLNFNEGGVFYRTGEPDETSWEPWRQLLITSINGYAGIGTNSPSEKLEVVNGEISVRSNNSTNNTVHKGIKFWTDNSPYYSAIRANRGSVSTRTGLSFFTANGVPDEAVRIQYDGNVGIGTTSPDYKLDVEGTIRAHEIKVNLDAGADFVFEEDYNLMPLNELETFVKTQKHLPEVAPAKEMETEGLSISEMNIKLLQKIEELTLYTIEQERKIENYDRRFKEQDNRIEKLEDIIKKLQ